MSERFAMPVVTEKNAVGCCGDDCCGGSTRVAETLAPGLDPRTVVREKYGAVAQGGATGCGCGCAAGDDDAALAALGYTEAQRAAIPEGADLGLGCGNPIAHAALVPGEIVLDLGSGGGIDCFLAAREVGPTG